MCKERLERDYDDKYSKHGIRLKCIHAVKVEKFLYHNGPSLIISERNTQYQKRNFQCGHCSVAFTQTKNLLRHLRSQHNMNESHRCPACPTIFGSPTTLNEHEETVHLHQPLPMSQLNMFATGGSGWVVDRLSRLEIKTAQIASSPPGTYIETPPILRNLKKVYIALQLRYFLLLVLQTEESYEKH